MVKAALPFGAVLMGLACLMATPVPAADTTPHRLTLNVGQHAHIARVFEVTAQDVEGSDVQHAHSRRDYLDNLVPSLHGVAIDRRLTAFVIDAPLASDDHLGSAYWQAKVLDIPRITFNASPDLEPREVSNWADVRPEMLTMITGHALPEDEAYRTMLMTLDDSAAAHLLLRDDAFLAIVRGIDLVVGTPAIAQSVRPAPLGGGTVAYSSTTLLTGWDEAADTAEIDYLFAPQPQSLASYLNRVMGPTIAPGAGDSKKAQTAPSMTLSTHCHYLAAISTGLIRQADCETRFDAHGPGLDQSRTMTESLSEAVAP